MIKSQEVNSPVRQIAAIVLQNMDNGEITVVGNDSLSYEDMEAAHRDCSHRVVAYLPVDVPEALLSIVELPIVVASKKACK